MTSTGLIVGVAEMLSCALVIPVCGAPLKKRRYGLGMQGHGHCAVRNRAVLNTVNAYTEVMGVSTTGESEETMPTWILILEIYWRISPVKIRVRPEIDPLTFYVSNFFTQNLATPEK